MKKITAEDLAKKIDHTVLKAVAIKKDILKLCAEAKQFGFASVCVNPVWVPLAASELAGSTVKVCTVVGFPLGANAPSIKAKEAEHAVLQGATEVDMVISIGAIKNGEAALVEEDIRAVVQASHQAADAVQQKVLVKVIIETCYLTDDEKVAACLAAKKAGADFVKTSTGFGSGGATLADVALMKKTVGSSMQVKASGGIRNLETALAMIDAGADRLGVSAGVEIIGELTKAGQ